MLSKRTVLILGAGASAPYGFKTGRGQLDWARALGAEALAAHAAPFSRALVPQLNLTLRDTGERSIDAMLRADSPLLPLAKALMARDLLRAERVIVTPPSEKDSYWYRTLYAALPRHTLHAFRRAPLAIYTFNYDRSLDYFLWRALAVAFPQATATEVAEALDCIGPFHLHGQLGRLYTEAPGNDEVLEYGGSASPGDEFSDSDVQKAARQIKLISETYATDEFFVRAQNAISEADQVVFLGFGFHPDNLAKLRLRDCLRHETQTFASACGLTQQHTNWLRTKFGVAANFGNEGWDVARFLAVTPQILD